MSSINVLFLGATGYLGGTVLSHLLSQPNLQLTALVRDTTKASKLDTLGVTPVPGSLSNFDLLEKLSTQADVVFQLADSDDLKATQALLLGSKKHFESTSLKQRFIHVSGIAAITDTSFGTTSTSKIYTDLDIQSLESLPPTQMHRGVDLSIVDADNQGYISSYVILPGYIFGKATGKLVDLGIQRESNKITSLLLQPTFLRGAVGHVGEGKNVWAHVHVHEVADLIIHIFAATQSDSSKAGHGREGFYFVESSELSISETAKITAEELFAAGKITSSEPKPYTKEELDAFFPPAYAAVLGGNARCRAERGRALGWKPVKTVEDARESRREQVKEIARGP